MRKSRSQSTGVKRTGLPPRPHSASRLRPTLHPYTTRDVVPPEPSPVSPSTASVLSPSQRADSALNPRSVSSFPTRPRSAGRARPPTARERSGVGEGGDNAADGFRVSAGDMHRDSQLRREAAQAAWEAWLTKKRAEASRRRRRSRSPGGARLSRTATTPLRRHDGHSSDGGGDTSVFEQEDRERRQHADDAFHAWLNEKKKQRAAQKKEDAAEVARLLGLLESTVALNQSGSTGLGRSRVTRRGTRPSSSSTAGKPRRRASSKSRKKHNRAEKFLKDSPFAAPVERPHLRHPHTASGPKKPGSATAASSSSTTKRVPGRRRPLQPVLHVAGRPSRLTDDTSSGETKTAEPEAGPSETKEQ